MLVTETNEIDEVPEIRVMLVDDQDLLRSGFQTLVDG